VDAFESIGKEIDVLSSGERERHPFYMFEPWDVEKRSDEQMAQAEKDGIDLFDPHFVRHTGTDPHPYQTGFLLDDVFVRSLQAGTQAGKSCVAQIEIGIMISGEIPHALRYEKGVDTGVKRLVTPLNIKRWGRRDSRTGSILDHNINAAAPESWKEWNCGNIIGVGLYPTSKIAEQGSQIWVCTIAKGIQNFWWPAFTEPDKLIFPEHFIDRNKGNNGSNSQDQVVFMVRGCKIVLISYESGFDKTEELKAHEIILDEPPPEEMFQSAQQHASRIAIVETPYKGISFTKNLMFPETPSPQKKVYHATQYDSPYVDNDQIAVMRENMKPWDIGARVWGLHSEVKGEPYFDRGKLMIWLRKYTHMHEMAIFQPRNAYFGCVANPDVTHLSGLIDTPVDFHTVDQEDRRYVWRSYERVLPLTPYVLTADPAEGSETPEDAADVCAAIIARPLSVEEAQKTPEACPFKIVATLRSTLPTMAFARACSHAMRYYNNALLGAETQRGFWNGTFAHELKDWPYWYMISTMQDKSGKPKRHKGFDPNSKTRDSMYDLVDDWIAAYGQLDYPDFRDEELMKELVAAVRGKNGRCDHTSDGTLDTVTCFGIMLYIYKFGGDQIVYNGDIAAPDYIPKSRHGINDEKGVDFCGMNGLGYGQDR